MKEIRADLHLHTCLSPCGELEMVPTAIVRHAKAFGLDMIAICDHNSGENVLAVIKAARREGISVIPGIEIASREEVHLLGLFASERQLRRIHAVVDDSLPGENDRESFGDQVIVDEWDEPTEINPKLLIGATTLTLEEVVDAIHHFGGLAIAPHIDREGFGLLGQLGFIPPGLRLDALEVSSRASHTQWADEWPAFPVITSSDAHRLADIGKSSTTFLARAATFDEIRKALTREGGRKVLVH
jgi:predicted metal-dependent phosphoesterase TrpH